jgi:hypothetical protein
MRRVYSARDVVGLWVFDERGYVLGEVVGIVHHSDGSISALLDGGPRASGTGRTVSLEGATVVDGAVHLAFCILGTSQAGAGGAISSEARGGRSPHTTAASQPPRPTSLRLR